MLSGYSKELKGKLGLSNRSTKKLAPNLGDIVHHGTLKLYQSKWMKPYIDFNTQQRMKAKNGFEKDFFELMNNSVFGKNMENLRKHTNVKLILNEMKFVKYSAKPTFEVARAVSKNLTVTRMVKKRLKLNRPIYVSMSVLNISKILIYNFRCEYMMKKYLGAKMLSTDTDSLTNHVKIEDICKEMYKDKNRFDFSRYKRGRPCYDWINKKKIGKIKDEMDGVPIKEFVGLRLLSKNLSLKKHIKRQKVLREQPRSKPPTKIM